MLVQDSSLLHTAATRGTYVMRGAAANKALDTYHLILAPTHACNLKCRHCYLPDHSVQIMTFEQVRSLIDQWEEIVIRDRGHLGGYFHLKGGEPLVLPYLSRVLDTLAESGKLRFMMTTNGTFMKRGFRESLLRLHAAAEGTPIIIVSLDGSCEEVHSKLRGSGNFAKSERFARTLIDDGVNVHFNYVVHSENLSDVPDFVRFAERVGATQVNFLPMVPKGFGAEMGEKGRPDPCILNGTLRELYREGGATRRQLLAGNYADILAREQRGTLTSCECVAGYKGLFYITPEGNVYSCPNLVDERVMLGNFLQTDLRVLHDDRIPKLYDSRLSDPGIDDRYMCRGERFRIPESHQQSLGDIPVTVEISADKQNEPYSDPVREVQEILLAEGVATTDPGRGVSYCFSRNF